MYGGQVMSFLAGVLTIMFLIALVITVMGVIAQEYYKGYAKFAIICSFFAMPGSIFLYWIFARPADWNTLTVLEEEDHDW